ncbi:hypothetical protein [Kineococcus sp. G2]|uniref:hypothetical protein n=1 Tax=Kineococcus sp. G2 TaxID=3127484 RepID=UPI00301D9442
MPPRHRAPGRARYLPAVRVDRLLVVAALASSAAAVVLSRSGRRSLAVAVGGLVLAVSAVLAERRARREAGRVDVVEPPLAPRPPVVRVDLLPRDAAPAPRVLRARAAARAAVEHHEEAPPPLVLDVDEPEPAR